MRIPLFSLLFFVGCVPGPAATSTAYTSGSGTGDADDDDANPSAGDSADTDPDASTSPEGGEGDHGEGSTGEGSSSGDAHGGIPVLGDGTHSIDSVELSVIATAADELAKPTDLAFNPEVPGQLWVVNWATNSIVIIEQAGRAGQSSSHRYAGATSDHFLARPSGIAFGTPGVMATSQQTDEPTQSTTPWDFMGPTLWGADPSFFDAGDASHLDMLHNSPNSSGIAWESRNIYWVHDGEHGSLTRYDFHADHGLGGIDHSDGEVYRFAAYELGYEPGVASHVAFHHATGYVYCADTANNRIFVLDSNTGTIAGDLPPNYDGGIQRGVNGASYDTMVSGADMPAPMSKPSGLEIHDDYVFVTDNETSIIFGLTLDGHVVDWLETELPAGTLMGIAFDTDGSLFAVDAAGDRVLRIAARG